MDLRWFDLPLGEVREHREKLEDRLRKDIAEGGCQGRFRETVSLIKWLRFVEETKECEVDSWTS